MDKFVDNIFFVVTCCVRGAHHLSLNIRWHIGMCSTIFCLLGEGVEGVAGLGLSIMVSWGEETDFLLAGRRKKRKTRSLFERCTV